MINETSSMSFGRHRKKDRDYAVGIINGSETMNTLVMIMVQILTTQGLHDGPMRKVMAPEKGSETYWTF